MQQDRKELLMDVGGMTSERCADAVAEALRSLDGEAEVEVDLAHGRARIRTTAQSLEVADALNRAGFEARAMTL
jgi:copper chaperone